MKKLVFENAVWRIVRRNDKGDLAIEHRITDELGGTSYSWFGVVLPTPRKWPDVALDASIPSGEREKRLGDLIHALVVNFEATAA